MKQTMPNQTDKFGWVLQKTKAAFAYAFGFSFMINLLMLGMSIYSLQVLDRVLSSNSLETLLMLSIIMLIIFLALSALQMIRAFIFLEISNWLDSELSGRLLKASLNRQYSGAQPLRDLSTLKSFVTGQATAYLCDAPWAMVFLFGIFFIHPLNGWVTVLGAITLTMLAWFNERMTNPHLEKANEIQVVAMQEVESMSRNTDVMDAMGMSEHLAKNWQALNQELNHHSSKALARSSAVIAATKGIRMTMQMVTMGIGAALVINQQMSAGGIIATSILAGKALAPFDGAMVIWKSWIESKKAYDRLNQVKFDESQSSMTLPDPKGALDIQKCVYCLPQTGEMIIKGVNISVKAGQCIGIVGASGSGKTTLARLITGVLTPSRGAIRLDGAEVSSWDKIERGHHMGYLPQGIELFPGSVFDNIARMNRNASQEGVLQATEFTKTHELILTLSDGYETMISAGGHCLSAGQQQRIGLARAFYGSPKLVVLDEPNSNLDSEGEAALCQSIKRAKKSQITTLIISHKPAILNLVDHILIMHQGEPKMFDQAHKVLAMLSSEPSNGQNL